MHILIWLIFGLIVGVIAKFLMPGNNPGGFIATTLLGIGGAFVGGWIGRALGMFPPGHPTGFLMAIVGAVIVLAIYHWATRQPIR